MSEPERIDIHRERTVGEILRLSVLIYWRYPFLFAVLAAGVIAPYELIRMLVTGYGPLSSNAGDDPLLFELISFSFVTPLVSALHIHAVSEIGAGRKPRVGPVAVHGLRVLPVVAAATIAATFLTAIGFVLLIVPGIILTLRFAVVAQTAAIDHEGWVPALRRSRQLTAGHYEHVFGLLFFTYLLVAIVALAGDYLYMHATGLPRARSHGTGAGWAILGIAVHTIVASFTALTLAILYFDLRAGQEPAPASVSWQSE